MECKGKEQDADCSSPNIQWCLWMVSWMLQENVLRLEKSHFSTLSEKSCLHSEMTAPSTNTMYQEHHSDRHIRYPLDPV